MKKGVTDHNKTAKRKEKIEHHGNIQRKYFVTVFLIRGQFSNGETFWQNYQKWKWNYGKWTMYDDLYLLHNYKK